MSDPTFDLIFSQEGAVRLLWERASRCTCWSEDTKQPGWDCTICGGSGVLHEPGVEIRGLYRSRGAWTSKRMSGEHILGQADLTTSALDRPLTPACQPGWVDDRVRDRFTVIDAAGDVGPGTKFYPSSRPVPFIVANVQEAWRVQVAGADQATLVKSES